MSLQELDLHIVYRPGRSNAKADALSCYPVEAERSYVTMPFTLVASTKVDTVSAKDGEPLSQQQRSDPYLCMVIEYLESGALPADKPSAQEMMLSIRCSLSCREGQDTAYSTSRECSGGSLSQRRTSMVARRDIREWCLTCIQTDSSFSTSLQDHLIVWAWMLSSFPDPKRVIDMPKFLWTISPSGQRCSLLLIKVLSLSHEYLSMRLSANMGFQESCCPTKEPHSCRS